MTTRSGGQVRLTIGQLMGMVAIAALLLVGWNYNRIRTEQLKARVAYKQASQRLTWARGMAGKGYLAPAQLSKEQAAFDKAQSDLLLLDPSAARRLSRSTPP